MFELSIYHKSLFTKVPEMPLTWKLRSRVSPAFLPPNHAGLVTVKSVPLPVTSASQNSRPGVGMSVLMLMLKLVMPEIMGMFRL